MGRYSNGIEAQADYRVKQERKHVRQHQAGEHRDKPRARCPHCEEAIERLAESLRGLEHAQSCSPSGPAWDSEQWARMRITALWPDFSREFRAAEQVGGADRA